MLIEEASERIKIKISEMELANEDTFIFHFFIF